MQRILSATALVVVLASAGMLAQNPPAAAPAAPAPVKATPRNAAAFLGEWDLSGQGSNGPASLGLSVKAQDQALAVVLTNSEGVGQAVNDVSMVGADLSVSVSFNNAGNDYPAVVTLTPSEGKVLLHIEVAGGLAQLDGTATKKIQK